MRLFYQIYYDGFHCCSDNDKVKILSILQQKFDAYIESIRQDSHQFVIRYKLPENILDNRGSREELKLGDYFIQVSSAHSAEMCKLIFDEVCTVLTPYIDDEEDQEIPF